MPARSCSPCRSSSAAFSSCKARSWLACRGRIKEAEAETERLLLREPPLSERSHSAAPAGLSAGSQQGMHWSALFKGEQSQPDHPGFGSVVPAGSRAPTASGSLRRPSWRPSSAPDRSSAQHRRAHPERYPGHQGRGVDRCAADRGDRVRRAAGRPRGPHPPAGPRLHRLRRRAAAGGAVARRRRNARRRAALCRLHAVQLHDQYRARMP